MKNSIVEANKLDREVHKLSELYSSTRIKVGLELAERLYTIDTAKLYLKIDGKAYPNFRAYISSLGISYYSCKELIGIYQTFVLVAGYSVEELSSINYHKLAAIKPEIFRKENGEYVLSKTKQEIKQWIADASSDLSIADLKQKRRESKAGEHRHAFEIITFKRCIHCGLRTK